MDDRVSRLPYWNSGRREAGSFVESNRCYPSGSSNQVSSNLVSPHRVRLTLARPHQLSATVPCSVHSTQSAFALTNFPGPIRLSRHRPSPSELRMYRIMYRNRLASSLAGETTKSNMRSPSQLPAFQPPLHGTHRLSRQSDTPHPIKPVTCTLQAS